MEKLPVRILKEVQRMREDPVDGINVTQDENNLRLFHVNMIGPPGTPYEKGCFKLQVFLPAEYPIVPPKVIFITKVFHPNINYLGMICLDLLKNAWNPTLYISTVLLCIHSLLASPNPYDALSAEVAKIWIDNEPEAILNAKQWTEIYASRDSDQ